MPRLPWVIAMALASSSRARARRAGRSRIPERRPRPCPRRRLRRTAGPRPSAAVFLVRSVLMALHQANQTGNYTVLRDISAPDFARANTAARLAEIFAPQREQQVDLSEAAILDPDLATPELTPHGHLRLSGAVRSSANRIAFDLVFSPVEGRWRLDGIATNILPLEAAAAPARPNPGPPPALRTSTSANPAL